METHETQRGRLAFFDENLFDLSSLGRVGDLEDDEQGPVQRLVDYIENESDQLIPIISNGFRTDWILDDRFNRTLATKTRLLGVETPEFSYVEQRFARSWAMAFKDGFPFGIPSLPKPLARVADDFPDIQRATGDRLVVTLRELISAYEKAGPPLMRLAAYNHLAQVAQYRQIIPEQEGIDPQLDDFRTVANRQYLQFLKLALYHIARDDESVPRSLVRELRDLIDEYSFSDLAQDLGYPRFTEQYPDLLRRLAKLPVPLYITTSYHDFLERLLQAEGKKPQTQICFPRDEPKNLPWQHRLRDIEPTVMQPVVFHLFGYEKYPSSLVISEGDYLDFLTVMARDYDTKAPKIPLYIRDALSNSASVILGYRLLSWDFRIMFRALFNREGQRFLKYKVALHIDPQFEEAIQDNERARRYIAQYFKSAGFSSLQVGSTVEFVEALWKEWERRQT
jgi:hypothetical protein